MNAPTEPAAVWEDGDKIATNPQALFRADALVIPEELAHLVDPEAPPPPLLKRPNRAAKRAAAVLLRTGAPIDAKGRRDILRAQHGRRRR